MDLKTLQVEIKPYTPGQTVALASRMLQYRTAPILFSWAFSSLMVFCTGIFLLNFIELHPFWSWLVLLVFYPLCLLPLIITIGKLIFSPAVKIREVISQLFSRLYHFSILFLASRFLVISGLLTLLIPGLYLWRASWFLGPIVLLEGSSLRSSIKRIFRFSLGYERLLWAHAANTGMIFLYLTVAFASLVHFFIETFSTTFFSLAQIPFHQQYYQYLALAGVALALPFATLIWFFVYLDVRIRKEGWDLEIAFRSFVNKVKLDAKQIT